MKSVLYLLIIGGTAIGIGIVFYAHYRPIIIERGCAEIAQQTTSYFGEEERVNSRYTFDSVKERCLEDALK